MKLKLLTNNSEYEFIAVYIKGKRGTDYRFLLKRLTDNEYTKNLSRDELFYVDITSDHASFMGVEWVLTRGLSIKSPTHMKLKNYNYYFLDNDYKKLETELQKYKNNIRLYPQGGGMFTGNYRAVFEFNGILY